METVLSIATNVLIIGTFPLHCRYLYVMVRNDAQISSLDYAFRHALTNIVIANLLYSLVFILIQQPASYGFFADFYKSQAWWLGKLFIMQAVPVTMLTVFFHLLIALNRLSALCFPMRHGRLWSELRVKRLLIVCWTVAAIECIPLIYPTEGEYYNITSPLHTVGVAFRLEEDLPNLAYQILAVGVGGLMEILVVLIYAFIGCRVSRLKNLPHSTASVTICALLVSTGGFVIILVVLPYMLAYRIAGVNLWSPETFNALFKFAFAYNNAVAPWVMVIYYRNVRTVLPFMW
ncbi:hypothetical protein PRIPAC_77346 [Pristionchus pacificus]|uniref:G protein-coupled receptor n=1 Tax=Pristionchus pacificus TaxID=54126 RepID=A0A2A6BWS5_PRIPA|nr:hypothetical protein PRIPAC_77346 [Pristionchus pacificus]|eukprot:PDM70307.1 G protein-coupled receptor [Pristionchus pacificus]